ncbi:hexose carrier protein [Favolaschia claudopus]|uniref:Hexose carrier protein n=1 Tax=Favolaschia claudopus TaxID=2862362 RepID=A0AAV9Z528_9AGAR
MAKTKNLGWRFHLESRVSYLSSIRLSIYSTFTVTHYTSASQTRLGGWVTVACTAAMGVFRGIIITPDFLKTMGNPIATPPRRNRERLGRKKTFFLGVMVMSIGALMQVFAFTVTQMIVARIITGLMNTATAPVWQSETCKSSWHGKLVVYEMVMNIVGFSISNWMTYGFSFITGLRLLALPHRLSTRLLLHHVLHHSLAPESPRWLLMHGHEAAGVEVLGDGVRANDDVKLHQKAEIMDAVRMERDAAPSWSDILHMRSGETGMIQCLLLGAQLIQQLVGMNPPLVLQNSVGLSSTTARLLAAWNSVPYLLFAFAGIALSNVPAAANSSSGAPQAIYGTRYGAGATVFFFLYYLFFGICWQGVPWLYPVEINSLSMRTKGAALATAINWLSNYIIVEITPPGIEYLGWRFYLIWMFFNALFVPTKIRRQKESIEAVTKEQS